MFEWLLTGKQICMYWLDFVRDWWLWEVNVRVCAFPGRLRTKQPLSTPSGMSSTQVDSRARSRTKMVSQSQRKCLHMHVIDKALKHAWTCAHIRSLLIYSLHLPCINYWLLWSMLLGNICALCRWSVIELSKWSQLQCTIFTSGKGSSYGRQIIFTFLSTAFTLTW